MFTFSKRTILIGAAILVAAAAAASAPAARQAIDQRLPAATSAGQTTLFGHIDSLVRKGNRYELRFDPALWLTGVPAERACGCRPVANDHFIVNYNQAEPVVRQTTAHELTLFACHPPGSEAQRYIVRAAEVRD